MFYVVAVVSIKLHNFHAGFNALSGRNLPSFIGRQRYTQGGICRGEAGELPPHWI